MKQYLDLLKQVRDNGVLKSDRTNTGTRSLFGAQLRFNLQHGFPAVTTKKLHWNSVVHELLWFIAGDTNTKYLNQNGVHIWDAWADDNGNLGPIYGKQWRDYVGVDGLKGKVRVDQLAQVISSIKNNPDSRRHIVNAWNPAVLPDARPELRGRKPHENVVFGAAALPPCHLLFQFYVAEGKLSCQMYQRSADMFLGVPFNIASYALLTHMIAQVCDLEVGEFIHTFGDAHIYDNHIHQVNTQLLRRPKPLPTLWLNPDIKCIDDFKAEDIALINYHHDDHISAPIAV